MRASCAVDVTLPVITAQTMAQDLERSQAAPVVATCLGPRRPRSGAGEHRSLCGRRVRGREAVARDRHSDGARRPESAGGLEHQPRGGGAIGVATSIGLVLTVLIVLALRDARIGGHRDRQHGRCLFEHRPGARGHRGRYGSRRRRRRIRARAPGRRMDPLMPCATSDATLPPWSTTSGLP